jgi:hypothetical protein
VVGRPLTDPRQPLVDPPESVKGQPVKGQSVKGRLRAGKSPVLVHNTKQQGKSEPPRFGRQVQSPFDGNRGIRQDDADKPIRNRGTRDVS